MALSVCAAADRVSAGLHWLGLALLMLSVGPVVSNGSAIQLRCWAWRRSVDGMVYLTGLLAIWYLLRLPSYGNGVGGFSAFINHTMLLGPITGLGVAFAVARAWHRRSWQWGLFAFIGFMPSLASGSRVAVLATCVAIAFLLVRRKPWFGVLFGLGFALAVFGFVKLGASSETGGGLTGAISQKGNQNTRAALWESRIAEFQASPLIGIGIAMGTGDGASEREKGGGVNVEPGSCYLAVLSMTGVLGTVSFFSALGITLDSYRRSRHKSTLDKDMLSMAGVYLAVHGLAEGWILGFGHPLCFVFWLWLGNVADAGAQQVEVPVKPFSLSTHCVNPTRSPS